MRYLKLGMTIGVAATMVLSASAYGQAFGLREVSEESAECISCHKKQSAVIYQQWGESDHFRANVGCFECHTAERNDVDAMDHYGYNIAVLVTPKDCARCHTKEVEEFTSSHHAKAGRILGSLDNRLRKLLKATRIW